MVHSRVRLRITLIARRTAHFTRVGVALINAADSPHCGRKGNKLKRRRERERKARQIESEIPYKKRRSNVGGKNNSQASDHSS